MKILKIMTGELGVNTYFAVADDNSCVVIDAGEDYKAVTAFAKQHGLKITACLLTHGHFDHVGACAQLQKDGVKIYISRLDADKLSGKGNLGELFGRPVAPLTADVTFGDGDEIREAGLSFRVLETPGHSRGSVCFITGNVIFSGDTMFYQDCGRTDFPDGSQSAMIASLNKLLALDGDYTVYPGHGRATTLSHERANSFLSW